MREAGCFRVKNRVKKNENQGIEKPRHGTGTFIYLNLCRYWNNQNFIIVMPEKVIVNHYLNLQGTAHWPIMSDRVWWEASVLEAFRRVTATMFCIQEGETRRAFIPISGSRAQGPEEKN